MATTEEPFEYLEDLSWQDRDWAMPKPLKHPDDPNKIIITTDYENNGGIFELDLISNQSKQLHQYDTDKIKPTGDDHDHFIHPQSKSLFIFGGLNSSFVEFNLLSKDTNYTDIHEFCMFDEACYVQSRNELHAVSNDFYHCIFEFNDNKMELISRQDIKDDVGFYLVHVPSQHKLMTFGAGFRDRDRI